MRFGGNAVIAVAASTLALLAPAAGAATPEYFNLPAGYETTAAIATGADGTVWFAADQPATKPAPTPGIGRLNPALASPGTANGIETFPTPSPEPTACCANFVRSVAVDSGNRRVWFAQSEGVVGFAAIAALSPGTQSGIQAVRLAETPDLWDIAVAPGGLAWFTERSASNVAPNFAGDRIASISSALTVTESENIALQGGLKALDSERYDAQPEGITTDASGKPWFVESSAGLPGYRVATSKEATGYTEYVIKPCQPKPPCSGSNTGTGPSDVAVAADGSVWFTNELKNEFGRLDVGGSTFTSYSLPAIDAGLASGQPRGITAAPDGTLWLSEWGSISHPNANALVRIVPTQPAPAAEVFKLGAGHAPLNAAADTRGNIWFSMSVESQPFQIGRLAGVVGAAIVPGSQQPPAGGGTPGGGAGAKTLTPSTVAKASVTPPHVSGSSVTVNQICVGPPSDPCSLVYLISSNEYVSGFPGSKASVARASIATRVVSASVAAARKRKKPKPVILARKALTLHGGEHRKVTITLNSKGKALLARKHKLTLYFTVTQAGATGAPAKVIRRVKVTLHAKPKR
jgi:streptogramin lyase